MNWREKDYKNQAKSRSIIESYLKNDQWATKFCMDLIYIAHLWDDLVDKDKERTTYEISDAFRLAMCGLTANPFYVTNISQLHPLIMDVILKYDAVVKLEKSKDDHTQLIAFTLSNALLGVIAYCIFLVGGINYYREVIDSFYKELWIDVEEHLIEFLREKRDANSY